MELTLKERISAATKEAEFLAEYWSGTMHESLIRLELNNLLESISQPTHVSCFPLLEQLENTLAKAREESERSNNEG